MGKYSGSRLKPAMLAFADDVLALTAHEAYALNDRLRLMPPL